MQKIYNYYEEKQKNAIIKKFWQDVFSEKDSAIKMTLLQKAISDSEKKEQLKCKYYCDEAKMFSCDKNSINVNYADNYLVNNNYSSNSVSFGSTDKFGTQGVTLF